MAPRLKLVWLVVALSAVAANLPRLESAALAAGLDSSGEATAKEASGLYRQGLYEDAAKLFAKLVVDYPDMLIFERSLGACFYYLRKPEPALSNLRNYLVHRKDIPADDKAVVDRWIDEMEKLRAQTAMAAAVPVPPQVTAPASPTAVLREPAPAPVPAPVIGLLAPAPETPVALALSAPVIASAPLTKAPETSRGDLTTSTTAPTSARRGWWLGRKWTWAASGSALLLGIGATAVSVSVKSRYDELNTACGSGHVGRPGCAESDVDALATRQITANVLWGLTGAAALTAAILFFVEGRSVAIAPMAGESTGLLASVRF